MESVRSKSTEVMLSIPLALLIVLSGLVGLLTKDFYNQETLNWKAQAVGQDLVDLFVIVPALIITSVLIYRKNMMANLMWGGVLLYIIYTYTIYCFSVHFNKLFVVYCWILGLSLFSFIYCFRPILKQNTVNIDRKISNTIGIYFVLISSVFYLLWITEIIPAIMAGRKPTSLAESGLFTNPVHVLDISIILPAFFITGIFLMKQHALAVQLTPVILVFIILMDTTIGLLVVVMKQQGLGGNFIVAIVMLCLAIVSMILLTWYLSAIRRGAEKCNTKVQWV